MGRFCHPSTIACESLPGHPGRPEWCWFQLHFLGFELPPQVSLALVDLTTLLSRCCLCLEFCHHQLRPNESLVHKGSLKLAMIYLTSFPSWDVAPCSQSLFPLLLFLSIIDWHYLGCQWDHAGICYHVFHESSWFGVESPYNLLSRLRGLRVKGDAVNYSSSTGISQDCLGQTRKYGHPS